MAPKNRPAFYAVAKGCIPGVYMSWDECAAQTKGFPGAIYKKFTNAPEAEEFVHSRGKASSDRPLVMSPVPATPLPSVATSLVTAPTTAASRESPSGPSKRQKMAEDMIEDESGWAVVYTDGACKGNGKAGSIAGVGVWWGRNDLRNISERCPGVQTNNRAELLAIVRALETAPHHKRPLLIKTDSQYSIKCFKEWMPKWISNNWKTQGGEVKNKPLIQYLAALLQQRALEGQKVHLQYVKGHSGEEGNEGADALAVSGTQYPERPEIDWDKLRRGLENELERKMDSGAIASRHYPLWTETTSVSEDIADASITTPIASGLVNESSKAAKPTSSTSSPSKFKPVETDTKVPAVPTVSAGDVDIDDAELAAYADALSDPFDVADDISEDSEEAQDHTKKIPTVDAAMDEAELAAYADGLLDPEDLESDLPDD